MTHEATCEIIDEYLVNAEVYFDVCNQLFGTVHNMIPAKDLAGDDELDLFGFSLQDIARIKIAAQLGLMRSSTFH